MLTVPMWIDGPCWGTLPPVDLSLQPLLARRQVSLGKSEARRDRIRILARGTLASFLFNPNFTDDKIEASWSQGASREGTCSMSHRLLSVEADLVTQASRFFLNHADLFLLVYKRFERGLACV